MIDERLAEEKKQNSKLRRKGGRKR